MNPYYKELDKEHSAYFDVVWKSLEDKYINGISFNFSPTDVESRFDDKGKEIVPVINDMDIYGISLVSAPAYDDMFDVLDVAVRSAQNVIENKGVELRMAEDVKKEIKDEIKNEIKNENLQTEIERLKTENLEKDKQLNASIEAEKKAEMQRQAEELEKLKAELVAKDKMLQERGTPSKGLVPPSPLTPSAERERIREALKPIEEEKALGKALALQAEFKGLSTLPPETQAALKVKDDVTVRAKE